MSAKASTTKPTIDLTPAVLGSAINKATELQIRIIPGVNEAWTGSSAGLIAEGLVPSDVVWPSGSECAAAEWSANGLTMRLVYVHQRDAVTGKWLEKGDLWVLTRRPTRRVENLSAAIVYAREELCKALWAQTKEGIEQFGLHNRATSDRAFQAFMKILLPAKGRRKTHQS